MAKVYVKGRFFRNAFEAVVAADRYVSSALLQLDDETLRTHGHRRRDLEAKSRSAAPFIF